MVMVYNALKNEPSPAPAVTNTSDVDAVIPWVDSNDPGSLELLQKVSKRSGVSIDPARYTSNGEIYHCIKYILRFAPWFRKIYVVTNGQKLDPNMLDNTFEKVH